MIQVMTRLQDPVSVLHSLKVGTVPHTGLDAITVGREDAVRRVMTSLDSVTSTKKSELDFVQGHYGGGKSHLLDVAAVEGMRRGFAVARLVVNFDSCALHRAKLVHHQLANNLQLPDLPTVGLRPLLRNLVESDDFRQRAAKLYDDPFDWSGKFEQTYSFWAAGFFAASARVDLVEPVANWLGGSSVVIPILRHRLDGVCKPPKGMTVTQASLPTVISGLANALQGFGHSGLVLLLDEAENALGSRNTPLARSKAASLLTELVGLRSPLYVLAATTPDVGATLDEDLERNESRPRYNFDSDAVKFVYRRLWRSIEVTPLRTEDLCTLGDRIVALHADAFNWDAASRIDTSVIRSLARQWGTSNAAVRGFVRTVVKLLDLAEQYPGVPVATLFRGGASDVAA